MNIVHKCGLIVFSVWFLDSLG